MDAATKAAADAKGQAQAAMDAATKAAADAKGQAQAAADAATKAVKETVSKTLSATPPAAASSQPRNDGRGAVERGMETGHGDD